MRSSPHTCVGDELSIGTNLRVQVFPTIHRVPSQGYAVFASRRGGLLPELHGLTSDEIRELRQMGQAVQAPDTEVLEMVSMSALLGASFLEKIGLPWYAVCGVILTRRAFGSIGCFIAQLGLLITCVLWSIPFLVYLQVYTGDTTMAGLLENAENAYIFGAHTFIMELTYLDGDRSKAAEWGHIHLDDVICNAHLFEGVQQLVFVHISQKYSIRYAATVTVATVSSCLFFGLVRAHTVCQWHALSVRMFLS
jgi:hypothetical protein